MVLMTGKRALIEAMRAQGVKFVFGNPGTAEAGILDALSQAPDVKYVLAVQEGVAVGMADAYARATGEVGFLQLHIDSGLTNGFSLMNDAFLGGTPLVVIAGNKDIRKTAEGRSDLAAMAAPYAKWSVEITHPGQVPSVMQRAFKEAKTTPKGPVFVAFAANALEDEADVEIPSTSRMSTAIRPDPTAIDRAAEMLAGSSSPLMIVGDRLGESDGQGEAVEVAEMVGARVYGHRGTQVNFPTGHRQFLGSLSIRNRAHREALQRADAVLAVGVNVFDDFFYQPGPVLPDSTSLIHIDSNVEAIGRSEPTALGIAGDEKASLDALSDTLRGRLSGTAIEQARARTEEIQHETQAQAEAFRQQVNSTKGRRPMSPATMMSELAAALPENAVVCDDAISSKGALHAAMKFNDPDGFWGERGGAIGWGMGATLGLKMAYPDRPVVGVLGDGSAMMTIQGLWTAAVQKLPVVYLICNNASYRILKVNMNVYAQDILRQPEAQPTYMAMDFEQPFDLARIAQGFGVYGKRIEDPADIGPELKKALALGAPALLDVIVDGSL